MEWAEGIGCERACSDVTPSRIFCTESPYHASPLRVENSSSAMCLHSVFIRNNGWEKHAARKAALAKLVGENRKSNHQCPGESASRSASINERERMRGLQ